MTPVRSLSALLFLVFAPGAIAQLTLGTGDHSLEIGGYMSTFYNQRMLKAGETDHNNDRFQLRNAVVWLEGRHRNSVGYELQFDVASLAQAGANGVDPENPGLMEASIAIKCLPHLNMLLGYSKVPYGRSPRVPFVYSPYWQRAEMLRGDIVSVRDAGITLSSAFWHERIKLYGGAYTGLGEAALGGSNDASGRPEVIGRIEVDMPSRYRLREIDDKRSPVPMFSVGASIRTMDKSQPTGSALPAGVAGAEGLKVIDGVRTAYGVDGAVQYMGFSGQFELDQVRFEPQSPTDPLYHGVASSKAQGYVLLGGFMGQLNYFHRKSRSILSVRYEELNWNDLVEGKERRIGGAYAYQIRDFNFMIKAQYWHILEEETTVAPFKWTDQVRIGIQYVFS